MGKGPAHRLDPIAHDEMLFWDSEACFPERFTHELVCVEIDLPSSGRCGSKAELQAPGQQD